MLLKTCFTSRAYNVNFSLLLSAVNGAVYRKLGDICVLFLFWCGMIRFFWFVFFLYLPSHFVISVFVTNKRMYVLIPSCSKKVFQQSRKGRNLLPTENLKLIMEFGQYIFGQYLSAWIRTIKPFIRGNSFILLKYCEWMNEWMNEWMLLKGHWTASTWVKSPHSTNGVLVHQSSSSV